GRESQSSARLLLGEPALDVLQPVAAVAAEAKVGETAIAGRLPDPGLLDGEEAGDLARGEEAIAHSTSSASAPLTSFPQKTQPGRGFPRAKSSTFEACGYMRSMSSYTQAGFSECRPRLASMTEPGRSSGSGAGKRPL